MGDKCGDFEKLPLEIINKSYRLYYNTIQAIPYSLRLLLKIKQTHDYSELPNINSTYGIRRFCTYRYI